MMTSWHAFRFMLLSALAFSFIHIILIRVLFLDAIGWLASKENCLVACRWSKSSHHASPTTLQINRIANNSKVERKVNIDKHLFTLKIIVFLLQRIFSKYENWLHAWLLHIFHISNIFQNLRWLMTISPATLLWENGPTNRINFLRHEAARPRVGEIRCSLLEWSDPFTFTDR